MPDRRRLFFALWPGDEVRSAIVRARRDLPPFKGREAHPLDLHLTLFFLGEVDSEQRACIDAAAGGIRAVPFSLTLDQTGLWLRSRILWCGPSRAPEGLLQLQRRLSSALSDCGFQGEKRSYRPHVTLARKASVVPTGLLDAPVSWHCDRFVLATSEPVREPPRYRVLHEWLLDGKIQSTDS